MPASRTYPGLDHSPRKNWVEAAGGLPDYIERIAKHLHYEQGKPVGTAIAIAISRCKMWCATSKDPAVKTKACAAVAEWEELKAKSKAKGATK